MKYIMLTVIVFLAACHLQKDELEAIDGNSSFDEANAGFSTDLPISTNEVFNDCNYPDSECGCKFRVVCVNPSGPTYQEWLINWIPGTKTWGGPPSNQGCYRPSGGSTTSHSQQTGVWYDIDCIAHSSLCGDYHVEAEAFWNTNNNSFCTLPKHQSSIMIELDCGNGIQQLKLLNNLNTTCCVFSDDCGGGNDWIFINEFSVNDDCSIETDQSWDYYTDPFGYKIPPCYYTASDNDNGS